MAALNGLIYIMDAINDDILVFDPALGGVGTVLDINAVNPGTNLIGGLAGAKNPDRLIATIANGVGRFDIALHVPFPNGLVAFQFVAASAGGPMGWVRAEITFCTLANLSGVGYQPGGAFIASGAGIRVNYAAVGW